MYFIAVRKFGIELSFKILYVSTSLSMEFSLLAVIRVSVSVIFGVEILYATYSYD